MSDVHHGYTPTWSQVPVE